MDPNEYEASSEVDAPQGGQADRDAELFHLVDFYTRLPVSQQPTLEELEARHLDLGAEIWRCLEGARLFLDSNASVVLDVAPDSEPDADRPAFQGVDTAGNDPIGDFQILRELGRGGMGVVYEARQRSLGRRVALKVLPFTSTFDERQLQRFHNEATAAAQLEHPSIVPIYAIGSERGIHFYAMKLINGQHLAEVIAELRKVHEEAETAGTQSGDSSKSVVSTQVSQLYTGNRHAFYRRVAEFMRQAAEALDYAHQCGVVHRDIKPGNLMVDTTGKLWITDFGLAHIGAGASLTRTGEIFGTPRYMSPEQATGKTRLADHRVDIYSLGATFYEFLTLHPLFGEKDQIALLKHITQDEPAAPRDFDPALPHDLETILLKCIAKSPQDRYETAGELATDLGLFLADRPIRAKRPGWWEIFIRWWRRHPSIFWSATACFLLAFVILAWNHWLVARERRNTAVALAEAHDRFQKARAAADAIIEIADEDLAGDESQRAKNLRQKLLDTALVLYQDFLTIDELDPETEQQLTAIRDYIERFMQTISEMEGMPPFFLLLNPAVQDDLGLTPAQCAAIRSYDKEFRLKSETIFREARDQSREERLERLREGVQATETFMLKTLTIEQSKRLEQLALQFWPEKICVPRNAERLALTDAQILKIQTLLSTHESVPPNRPNGNRPQPNANPGWRYDREKERFARRMRLVESVLTPEQLAVWEEMRGEEMEFRKFVPRRRNEPPKGGDDPPGRKKAKNSPAAVVPPGVQGSDRNG